MIKEEDYRYIITNKSTSAVIEVEVNGEKYIVDPKMLSKSTHKLYSKDDAYYKVFAQCVLAGTPVSNYKRSKYYKFYMERAKIENPEFLFQ
jgi:hypothetical protein